MTTNEEWRKALSAVQKVCLEKFSPNCEYSTKTLHLDHGCPPNIPELNQAAQFPTDTMWQQERVLWSFPAAPHSGSPLASKTSTSSLGTTLWTVLHALKSLALEDEISKENIEKLKSISFHHKDGIAQAFVELGWSKGIFTDPNMAQGGDVGCFAEIDKNPHFWFVVAEQPHVAFQNQPALNLWSSSQSINGPGFDVWLKNQPQRRWVFARPFI